MKLSILNLSLFLSLSPMNAVELTNALGEYSSLLSSLEKKEQTFLREDGKPVCAFSKSVTLCYGTLTMELKLIDNGSDHSDKDISCTFEINQKNVSLTDVDCGNKDREEDLRDYIIQHVPSVFPNEHSNENIYAGEIVTYLTIADAIAKQGYGCSLGDDYSPGNFSEITINDSCIVLRQINHWNARSLDHKNDYHLRDLEFYIPLTHIELVSSFNDERIGRMLIRFSDRSSKNNKVCGDKIAEQLRKEKVDYEKR